MKKSLIFITTLFVLILSLTFAIAAAGDKTVVYLKNDGTGDGSSAASALGSLEASYKALDLSRDCTVVVCGEYKVPFQNFSYEGSYRGSVTFTSMYNGVDYRQSGAKYLFAPYCFACPCETKFENIVLESGNPDGSNGGVVFVAQHNAFTIGEGVTVSGGKNLTGGKIAQSFTIIGGYYKSVGDPLSSDTNDINITVLSGSKIYIVGANRNLVGTYGNVNITIGGDAEVSTLNATSAGVNGSKIGDIRITLKDNASIDNFYGSTQTMSAGSLTFNWTSGTISKFFWDCPYMSPVGVVTFNKTLLNASEKAQKRSNFADIASQFDEVKTVNDSVAAEKGTVVFLKDGGTGAGKTADDAVGNFLDAYEALDLSKDCTIVICGVFTTPKANYIYDGEHEGSVTFTSVHNGVDYRTSNAKFVFMPYCYGSVCATKFENINLESASIGSNGGVVFVARHYPFTLGEGVNITGTETLTGSTIARSFTIVGGYYSKVGETKLNDNREINIKVLSGSKVYIVTANRAIAGTYGNANVYIGGNASVSTFNATGANIDGATLGDITLTLADNAKISTFYGSTQTMTAASFTLNWNSGTIGKFYWDCPSMKPVGKVTFANGTTLNASDAAKNNANFSEISALFTTVTEKTELKKPDLTNANMCAVFLNKLNLLAGKGTTADGKINFDEAGSLTRAESIVQVIRFLGKENEVKNGNYTHPFTDVPSWADKYIGYAYTNKITSGRSATKFDPNGTVDEAQFLTLLLRAIGYSDAAGEFVWNNPFILANNVGMKENTTALSAFSRGDAFKICFATLYSTAKNGEFVANNLVKAGVFALEDLDKAASAALLAQSTNENIEYTLENAKIENGYYVIPIETYRDKTLCGMLSQIAGVLTGYEMVYLNGVPRFNLPDEWFEFLNGPYAGDNAHNKHEDKHTYNEELGVWQIWIDDDYSIDYFAQFMIEDMYKKYGMFSSKVIGNSWVDYCIYDMGGGHHTFGAYKLAKKGYFPAFLGNREYGNMYSYCGEPIIENETSGMIAAGMPSVAIDLANIFGHVTSNRDPVIWAEFFSTAYSLAYVENDIRTIIEKSAKMLAEGSWERYVVDECLKIHAANPNDWRAALLECEDRFYLPKYDKEDSMSEASIFSSIIVMGLLYGDGDYMETCKIIALQGNGGESACAVGLGIVGVMHGWKNLGISAADKAKMNDMLWQNGKGVIYNRSNTDISQGYWMHAANLEEFFKLSDLLDLLQRNFERMLKENGGRIENGNYYIPVTEVPEVDVLLTEDFESGKTDNYTLQGTVACDENYFTGKYAVKLSGNSDIESRLSRKLSGLVVGNQYSVTAYIRTTAKTSAFMYVSDGKNIEFVTVYDTDQFVKRELIFTATSNSMEFGIYIPKGISAFKYAIIDDIIINRVEEKQAAPVIIETQASDKKYSGIVNLSITGKLDREAFLKITFANTNNSICDVKVSLNGDENYGTVPFYKTSPDIGNSNSDTVYIPVVLNQELNTLSLDLGVNAMHIFNVEVVYNSIERW